MLYWRHTFERGCGYGRSCHGWDFAGSQLHGLEEGENTQSADTHRNGAVAGGVHAVWEFEGGRISCASHGLCIFLLLADLFAGRAGGWRC